MSEIIRDESISTESLCTVIENEIGKLQKRESSNESLSEYKKKANGYISDEHNDDTDNSNGIKENGLNDSVELNNTINDQLNKSASLTDVTAEYCDTTTDTEQSILPVQTRTKSKKSVSFDPNDEKIQKFITGEPIIDKQNPFKNGHLNGNASKKKRTPPPVPTRRSTLSIKKTVTQQLREREREKEKERERLKNEANKSKTQAKSPTSPDEFVTTEEVLKQSKYVKTYIKNPDPYFVYDPTVLARIKFEELRELADKKPPKKLKLSNQTRERLKDLKNKSTAAATPTTTAKNSKLPTFKKVSKPNYPDLSDIKIKVGTEPDGNYFNPAEVTKNAKKFDERVKILHIDSDVDLDEIDEPLTKSESSDEVTVNNSNPNDTTDGETKSTVAEQTVMNGHHTNDETKEPTGTFTNTITSPEFQQYLEKKGLTLIPKKIPSGAQPLYANGGTIRPNAHVSFRTDPEGNAHISIDTMDGSRNDKRPSVFQRLLANSIFASRRNKTTPRDTVPNPRSSYEKAAGKENGSISSSTPIKRVVLERQSFHGRPRVSNLLSSAEAKELQHQNERSRKSFTSGDDLSLSISSALTSADYANDSESRRSNSVHRRNENGLPRQPVSKPPRRSLSGDRLSSHSHIQEQRSATLIKPKVQRPQIANPSTHSSRRPERNADLISKDNNNPTQFRRSSERQSLIPKRTTPENDKRQAFGRSASMDRNEILRRTANRRLQNRANSASESLKVPTNSKENLRADFGPRLTSTPRQESHRNHVEAVVVPAERKVFSPVLQNSAKPANVYVDQLEWERLRAMKERTDRELYYKVLQQQQHQHQQHQQQQHQIQQQLHQQKRLSDPDSIYERLQPRQVIVHEPPKYISERPTNVADGNFVRGSPQRSTFSGTTQNRQVKIIDGRAVLGNENQNIITREAQQPPRSQSVLDNLTTVNRLNRRGYESDNETPVVLRRRGPQSANEQMSSQRRIGGLLTREEILQKVKEFCRKSLNKTPIVQQPQMQAIYEIRPTLSNDISPVSYASVERISGGGRMYASPQVPQRMQSLPQQFVPITQEINNDSANSPIYAHVVKRSSLQSNQSENFNHPQRPTLVQQRDNDPQAIYVRRGINGGATLRRGSTNEILVPTQYVIVDSEKIAPAQVLNYYPAQQQQQQQQFELYTQPQYVRPQQLQQLQAPYGYVTLREPILPPQNQHTLLRQPVRLMDGRSTPLILESSSSPQQASQIYWTPQHQRLHQQAGLLPVHISPRYVVKQSYPVPAPASRPEPIYQQHQQPVTRVTKSGIVQCSTNIPSEQSTKEAATIQNFSPILRTNTPTKQLQFIEADSVSQGRQYTLLSSKSDKSQSIPHAYEWESGSEAGEVQRIMERQRDSGGESKVNTILRNLKIKVSRFIRGSK